MSQISFVRTKDGKSETITFTEGERFELHGITFRIHRLLDNGKMIIKPD
jgi:hypothetical protein